MAAAVSCPCKAASCQTAWCGIGACACTAGPTLGSRPKAPAPTARARPTPLAPHWRSRAAQRELVITLPAAALPVGTDLNGVRVFVTTWDWDGGYRELADVAGPHTMGGRRDAGNVRWMDAIGPVTLRKP